MRIIILTLLLSLICFVVGQTPTPSSTVTMPTPTLVTPITFPPPPIPTSTINPLFPIVINVNELWSDNYPRVRLCVAVIPYPSEGALQTFSMSVQQTIVISSVGINSCSGYINLGGDSDQRDSRYDIDIFRSAAVIAIVSESYVFTGGIDYTILVRRTESGIFNMETYVDDNAFTPYAKVRVISNVQGTTSVNMNLLNNGAVALTNILPMGVSDYVFLPAGIATFQLAPNPAFGQVVNILYFNPTYNYPSIYLAAGASYTLLISGNIDVIPGGANSFGSMLILDSLNELIPGNPFIFVPNYARVRFAHFAWGYGTLETILTNIPTPLINFGQFSSYMLVPSGYYTYGFRLIGTTFVLDSENIRFTAGADYTLYLDILENGSPVVTDLVDYNRLPAQGYARVRFINSIASSTKPRIDIILDGFTVSRRLRVYGVSPYFPLDISNKNIPLEVKESKDLKRTLYFTPDLEALIFAGSVYTIVITGLQIPGAAEIRVNLDAGVGVTPEQITSDQIDSDVQEIIFENNGVGLSAAITDLRDVTRPIVWAKGFGWAILDNARRVTRTTKFVAAGISSLIVSTATFVAMNDSKIGDLNSHVKRDLPFNLENPHANQTKDITYLHLLTHTGTIVDNWDIISDHDLIYYKEDPVVALCEFVENYLTQKGRYYKGKNWLTFDEGKIGKTYQYSHIGVALVACAIENKYEIPFNDFAERFIFDYTEPASLKRSSYMFDEMKNFRTVAKNYYYDDEQNGWYGIERYMLPIYPAFNLLTTPTDLCVLLNNIIGRNGGKILPASSVPMMLADSGIKTKTGTITDGGWMLNSKLVEGATLIGHSADTKFGKTKLIWGTGGHAYWNPSTNTGVCLLINTDDDSGWTESIMQTLFNTNNYEIIRGIYPIPYGCQRAKGKAECDAIQGCRWIRPKTDRAVCAKAVVEPAQPFQGEFDNVEDEYRNI